MKQEETHPWKWFAPHNSKILIVGTFPTSKRNWSYNFFYPNIANLFWKIMAKIAKTELKYFSGAKAVIERKKILQKLSVAISDMGYKIIRNDDSSLDEKLVVIEYMDIFNIIKENPGIDKVIFTSSSGNVSASKWFEEFLESRNIFHKFPKGIKPVKSEIVINNKKVNIVIAYSPSRRAANGISFDKLVEMYKNEIV